VCKQKYFFISSPALRAPSPEEGHLFDLLTRKQTQYPPPKEVAQSDGGGKIK